MAQLTIASPQICSFSFLFFFPSHSHVRSWLLFSLFYPQLRCAALAQGACVDDATSSDVFGGELG